MEKFKFSLDVLLKVKTAEKKKLDNEIYHINQEIIYMEQELKEIEDKANVYDKSMQVALETGIDVYTLKDYALYRNKIAENIRAQMNSIETMNIKMEKLRQEYLKLKKALDVLRKLKRQQFNIYQYNVAQEQAKEIEDIISYKTSRSVQYGNT